LAKIGYSPQTDVALTNFKTILELELGLLMVGDIDWAGTSDFADPAAAAEAGPVLPAAAANDNNDNSSNETTVMAQPQQPPLPLDAQSTCK
jgi:hypothetical protein